MFDFSWFSLSWLSGHLLQDMLSSGAQLLDVQAFAVMCGVLSAMVVFMAMQFTDNVNVWGRTKPQLIAAAVLVLPLAHFFGGLTLLTTGVTLLVLNCMMNYLCANMDRSMREQDAYWKAAGYVHGLAARQACSK